MTEPRTQLADLFAACWKDEALKTRFISDPHEVLAEYGIPVPGDIDVKVVENGDDRVHITMPMPPSGHHDLTDEELSSVAGGTCSAYMWTSFMTTSKACPATVTEGMPKS